MLRDLWLALKSWRTASVTLLSFASGLPLGLVWIAIPDWMRSSGVDIRVVGLFTLAQAPWTLKFLWAPLMDRFTPGFWGRRRGWIAFMQVALCAATLGLAGVGDEPDAIWIVGALALAMAIFSATQDIALDAYAVDVLRTEEHGVAVGARTALYRAAMNGASGIAITLAGMYSWPLVNVLLAALYLPMLLVTWRAPEPDVPVSPPRTLRDAVWLPFLECLQRPRALEILAFVVFYKLADNLSQSLLRPFLVDMGYGDVDRGIALATVGLFATLFGTFLGGALSTVIGLGHSLWLFGLLQIFSNVGYVVITYMPGNRGALYGAISFEMLTTGLGMGAFGVLLLRITEKRFSATQYALFSSLFGLPRVLAGPVTGFMVDGLGWRTFFWFTMAAGIPGLILLQRFAPLGSSEPQIDSEGSTRPLSLGEGLPLRACLGFGVGVLVAFVVSSFLGALRRARDEASNRFDWLGSAAELLQPDSAGDYLRLTFIVVFGALAALIFVALGARNQPR